MSTDRPVTQARAAILRAYRQPFEMGTVTMDRLRDEEVLVRIAAVGVCQTDISIMEGYTPFPAPSVIGHEGAGTITAVGAAVKTLKVGDRVVLSYNYCGACSNCAHDMPAYCHKFMELNLVPGREDGSSPLSCEGTPIAGDFFGQSSFATHAIAHERNAIQIVDDVPFEILAPLGCGVQTGAGVVINSLQCDAGTSVCITGGGTLGLSAVMAAKLRECAIIIVVDPLPSRRALALELGATHVFDPASGHLLADFIRAILPAGANYMIDTTGSTAVIEDMLLALAAAGTFCLVGTPKDGLEARARVPLSTLLSKQVITGSIEGDSVAAKFIPYLVEMYRQGRFPIDRLIKTYPLEQINEAIAEQRAGLCVKPVLIP